MPERSRTRAWMAAGMLVVALHAGAAEDEGRTRIEFDGRSATVSADANGYRLTSGDRTREIARQPAATTTASPLFDALFALAQQELGEARVAQITDGAFNDGRPQPCECLQTGAKWPYVWTRDLAYATDLALFRFDPQRARNGLEFKLSRVRGDADVHAPADSRSPIPDSRLLVVQDTGSGGSWPVSTDRIVWFLGARHLLGERDFGDKVYNALSATLAQDRQFAFDAARGLYRGETSFLDWREQTYPDWTATNVVFIAESFALSTNVLHYEALRLAGRMAAERHDPLAARYRAQGAALARAIDRAFWREDRGLYMSYSGGAGAPRSIEAYDLLGTSLAILSGVAPRPHARRALADYPTWPAGSPVVWPERRVPPIYHNRAIWPFVSAYALKAARALDAPARIAHELRSILRGAALSGSNMENYEFTTQGVHVDDGPRSGPVVNSPRQLWSVAAYLDMVVEGVFGLTDRDTVEPKLPREIVPMLFGDRDEIRLELPGRRITLVKPRTLAAHDNLLVAAATSGPADDLRVVLRGTHADDPPLPRGRPAFAPPTPPSLHVARDGANWRISGDGSTPLRLYVNGAYARTFAAATQLPYRRTQQCFSTTTGDAAGTESLPSEPVCVGDTESVGGAWPRRWTAQHGGRYRVRLRYRNAHGPINTGITAAVKLLDVDCGEHMTASLPLVMPHSVGEQESTAADFDAGAGQQCKFTLDDGFNMSYLRHYAHYTGGEGGARPLNEAEYGELQVTPVGNREK